MKKHWITVLRASSRSQNEQGFTIPVAVGMGLITVLVATTMMLRSQDDQITALSQKATAQSLGIAETGTTRVQSLLNKYEFLANITLTNIAGTPLSSSWRQTYDTSTVCTTGATEVSSYRLNEWISLDSGGQFRITEYTYRPTSGPSNPAQVTGGVTIPASGTVGLNILPVNYLADGGSVEGQIQGIQGTLSLSGSTYTFERLYSGLVTTTTANFSPTATPGTGTLEVEGQVGTDATATSNLQVDIPVQPGALSSIPFPGLFLTQGSIPVNNEIQANLLVIGCSANIGGNVRTDLGYQRLSVPYLKFPDLPERPTTAGTFNDLRSITIPSGETSSPQMYVENGTITAKKGSLTFPSSKVGQNYVSEAGVKVYKYRINAINLNKNITVSTDANTKVIFYVEGNIDTGSKEITHNNSANTSHFQIFAYGTSTTNPLQPHVCMQGNGATYGFLFAPDYNIGIAGSGSGQATAGFVGAVWARQWNPQPGGLSACGSGTSNAVVTQTINWSDLGPNLSPQVIPPIIAPISSWQRQEVVP